jgi:hypothetical protein
MRRLALALPVLLAACGIPGTGPAMSPGEDCVDCHGKGEGPDFSAAGTVYQNPGDDLHAGVKGARVHLVDADGRSLTLRTGQTGNFYTREKLRPPLQISVERDGLVAVMKVAAPHGACNRCHTVPAPVSPELQEAAPGRVALTGGSGDEFMLPGQDCGSCHRAGGAASSRPFSSAGTVFLSEAGGAGDEGVTVTITGADGRTVSKATNRVGNFFLEEPIAFGDRARVRISKGGVTREMDEELPHGSCNACHRPGGEGEGRVSLSGEGGDD